jgi:hypothetical protein
MQGGSTVIECVYATGTFPATSATTGQRLMVHKGSHWPADDPIVQQHPGSFSSDPRYGLQYSREPHGWDDPPVETATAVPGERRQVRRRDH